MQEQNLTVPTVNIDFDFDLVQEENTIRLDVRYKDQSLTNSFLYLTVDPVGLNNTLLVKKDVLTFEIKVGRDSKDEVLLFNYGEDAYGMK